MIMQHDPTSTRRALGRATSLASLLIVDDDPRICRLIGKVADEMGLCSEALSEPEDLLQLDASGRDGLVLLDLGMPGLDGVEVLRRFASAHCEARICLISGAAKEVLESAKQLGLELGLDMAEPLSKPLDLRTLQDILKPLQATGFHRSPTVIDLASALDKGEIVPHYQPKVDIQSLRVVGMEALVRWNHTQLGMISPNQFIPLAEETGLIIPIGQWVLETACAQNKRWQALGFAPVRMGVNLSPVQFRQPDLLEVVQRTLRDTDVDPRWLELELTEGMLMHEVTATLDCLRGLKELGVHLSIDDFGTGYSSLSYLKQFPIDTLKIDQSFVRDVTSNADDAAIVTSIILMGHGLKLNIIAEGVETDSQLEFLRALRCNEIQGYLISPPVSADEAGRLLPTL